MFLYLELNLRIMPLKGAVCRAEIEDKLMEILNENGKGDVTGGGTYQNSEGEITGCDTEIELIDDSKETIDWLLNILNDFNFPKGSKLTNGDDFTIELGTAEGLAIYIDAVNLPDEVYSECDINFVISEMERLMGENGSYCSYWRGPQWMGLYFYGTSFEIMNNAVKDFISTYKLCQGCRIEQIA